MTATVEKTTPSAAMKMFDAWFGERKREEERGGRKFTSDDVAEKVGELGIEDELIAEAVAWARQGGE